MSKDSTPLMRQYFDIKSKYPDTVLLYRMGDFYETFDEDARTVHKILGITLTKRSNGKASEVALAGFPYHSLETYLPRLIRAGFRVAVCEQVEDPKTAKGIVKRDVIEIVTPGTTLSDKILDHKSNNFLAVVSPKEDRYGLAVIDVSTGEFTAGEFSEHELADQIHSYRPAEIVLPVSHAQSLPLRLASSAVWTKLEDWLFSYDYGRDTLLAHFKTHSLKGFGLDDWPRAIEAAGVAIHYLKETHLNDVPQINRLSRLDQKESVFLDAVTLRNLDIFGSTSAIGLIDILDHTRTAMGGRLLRRWLIRPLKRLDRIQSRLASVEEFTVHRSIAETAAGHLGEIADLERLISKTCANRINPRELKVLQRSLEVIPPLKRLLDTDTCPSIRQLAVRLVPLTDLIDELQRGLADEPTVQIKDGDVIRDGYNGELDELRSIARNSKQTIADLQQRERQRTGIASLKVQYNNVFGYYLEVTNAHKDKVPDDYMRKQTLVNSERYITPELKTLEEQILTAEEKILALEQKLFEELRSSVARRTVAIQDNASIIAELDGYYSMAEAAMARGYVKPVVTEGCDLRITSGRHPVVEGLLKTGDPFIPNDTAMSTDSQIHIITGPNMAGKSCYLRQVGLIVLMAQVGSFVPAETAEIGIVDRIFTRVGASDNMTSGESTFLVEMNETANILNNATERSLILLDEIGRGTSTFDGLALAWAIVEYLHHHPNLRPKTLFATHYHELNELENLFSNIKNYNMQVRHYQDKIIFVRKIVPGGCDRSFGIDVAKLAGLPPSVIARAREVMANLESHDLSAHREKSIPPPSANVQLTMFGDPIVEKIKQELSGTDLNALTPIEALNKLNDLKNILDGK